MCLYKMIIEAKVRSFAFKINKMQPIEIYLPRAIKNKTREERKITCVGDAPINHTRALLS